MLFGWALATVFFLGALGTWGWQCLVWLQDGAWTPLTPHILFGGNAGLQWKGAEQLLALTYDFNLGLLLAALGVISAEFGLFLASSVAEAIGEILKTILFWPYLIGVGAILAAFVVAAIALTIGWVTPLDIAHLPRPVAISVILGLTAIFAYALRKPMRRRLD